MKRVSVLIFSVVATSLFGQNQLGLRNSNFSGVNSMELNPSAYAFSPLDWDINILSAGLFFENEYLYVENTNFFDLLGHNGPILFRSTAPEAIQTSDDPDALYYNYFDATRTINNSLNGFIGMPSIAFKYKDLSFGVFMNARTAIAANNLDEDLDYFSIDQWPEGLTKTIDPFAYAGMSWNEIGVNVGFQTYEDEGREIYFGANLKYLLGSNGFYVRNHSSTQVTEVADTFLLSGGPYEYGISSNSLAENPNPLNSNGKGFGIDIGLNYLAKSFDKRPYKWRVGASIIDLGYVNFNENAQQHFITNADLYDVARSAFTGTGDLNVFTGSLSDEFLGDDAASLQDDSFTIFTPTALSLQFDYSFTPNLYLGGVLNQRLKFSKQMVDRENILAVAPRYDSRWFEAGLPVTVYDMRQVRLGAWFRVAFLTIGSEHLGSLFIKESQFTGSDIYVSIKINSLSGNRKSGPEKCNF